jgi:hypothetical protein
VDALVLEHPPQQFERGVLVAALQHLTRCETGGLVRLL